MNFINFGIDLGTTNSLIAKFEGGAVQVFKNPLGHKETLPSVVAFRGERIIVGDKAKEYISKDAGNVFGGFKRKMGASESFFVPSTANLITPMQLSAMVLKELKNFIHTGEQVEAAVITIPASFDTIQSNATKKAGYEAGFKEVVLLQEPIAASLAFFNDSKKSIPDKGHWLVYDLGGGTFDVALVSIVAGELRVVDHEGNNFLGGMDFDSLIIEQLIIPQIIKHTGDTSIEEQLRSRNGSLEKLFYVLLHKAEEAKKELSHQDETEIDFTLPDSDHEIYVRVTKEDLARLIHEKIASTIELIQTILKRNNLLAPQINTIIMVGGSTYIPYVRELVAKETGVPLSFDTDPTTAIAIGAAYYAGSKLSTVVPSEEVTADTITAQPSAGRKIKAVFQSVSSEEEELYLAMPEEGDFTDVFYRITRDDGGYDSGNKKVVNRISEFLPLQKLSMNRFIIRFFDEQNNPVLVPHPPIDIMHGKFNVAGQPLPNDICLEVDDYENNSTKLQVIFKRNDILPLKKTIYKEITRTIKKGSTDEIVINVLEGTMHSRPHSNLVIGAIEIKGTQLKTDLVKGSDVEIKFEMNESRDLTMTAFLAMSEQEFKNVFTTSEKYVSVTRLKDDVNSLVREMRNEIRNEKDRDEESEWNTELRQCIFEGEMLQQRINKMKESDITDEKYEISETRRRISSRYDALGKDQRLYTLQADYFNHKTFIEEALPDVEFDRDKMMNDFDRVVQDEQQFLKAKSPAVLRTKIDALEILRRRAYANTRHYIIDFFLYFAAIPPSSYTKPAIAATLIKEGEQALAAQQFAQLRTSMINLSHLLHGEGSELENIKIKGTGIG
jgi:molecular chaperone DnaK